PATHFLQLSWTKELPLDAIIELYDLSGKKVLAEFPDRGTYQERLDISSLKEGIYIIRINGNGLLKTQQILVTEN
ncbi:MAG: T9SS type A sorting domain-containing protein, partial [Bacteroidota bacterium]